MEETPDLRCTLLVRVSGKLVGGAHWEYKDGVTAEIKVDPESYTFYEFMDVIREIGYTVEKDNISVYYTLPPDMNNDINNGLVSLRNHDDMVNMFAAHLLIGMKYFCIDMFVDCPNVVDSEDEEFIGVDQGCITELGGDQEVGEGQGGGHQFGEVGVGEGQGGGEQDGDVGEGEGEVGVGVEGVDANKSGEMNDDNDDSSDSEWFPNDDSSTSTASFSGVEESSDEEEEESIPLEMAMAEDLEMIMAEEMIIGEERGLTPCRNSGRDKDKNSGSGRGARGGKNDATGGRGRGTRGRGGRGKLGGGGGGAQTSGRGGTMVVGGTGRGGDPAPNKGQVVIGGRGRGRGKGGSTPALPGVLIKERCEQQGGKNGKCKEPNIGKGKEPVIAKPKVPIPRFGGAGTVAPRIGLPNPQGWRRSSRIRNAVFWSQPSSSSAASCASGSGSGSATMPTTPIPRLDSQGACSTPSSTRKSGI
ncbi:hypothetical protein RHGRI_026289 [Rhododendron griersonianum]|uniref:Uncharacterized protein n=1 Tax=Rhododendron griersonianum TaxID=479676 RepID=A0AAV6IX78_9ERIC|nr:hypothetical protein RHGRI_026289 [Rhododendron griersonianum]